MRIRRSLLYSDHVDDPCVMTLSVTTDHVQITALTRALCVNIFVAYLDGRLRTRSVSNNDKGKGKEREAVEVEFVEFQNGEEGLDPVRLLYR